MSLDDAFHLMNSLQLPIAMHMLCYLCKTPLQPILLVPLHEFTEAVEQKRYVQLL